MQILNSKKVAVIKEKKLLNLRKICEFYTISKLKLRSNISLLIFWMGYTLGYNNFGTVLAIAIIQTVL